MSDCSDSDSLWQLVWKEICTDLSLGRDSMQYTTPPPFIAHTHVAACALTKSAIR